MTVSEGSKKRFMGIPVFVLLLLSYSTMFMIYLGILGYALQSISDSNDVLATRTMDSFARITEQSMESGRQAFLKFLMFNGVPGAAEYTSEEYFPLMDIPEGIELFIFYDDRLGMFGAPNFSPDKFEIIKVYPLMNGGGNNFFEKTTNNYMDKTKLAAWKAEYTDAGIFPERVQQIETMEQVYDVLIENYGEDLDFTSLSGYTEAAGVDTHYLGPTWFWGKGGHTIKLSYYEQPLYVPANAVAPGLPFQEHYIPSYVQVAVFPNELYWGPLHTFMENIIIIVSVVTAVAMVCVSLVAFRVAKSSNELVMAFKFIKDLAFDEDPMTNVKTMREISSIQCGVRNMKGALISFRKFIPKSIVDDMVAKQKAAEMNVQFRSVAVFFSDIQGFTTMVEKIPADKLMPFLHNYLSTMSSLVQKNDGTVIEYVGDAIMAAFNAPDDTPDFVEKGIMSMIDQQDESGRFSDKWMKAGVIDTPIKIRMGMHQDKCLAGVFGSDSRLKYGLTGDAVNLAARLEEVCKQYGVFTCISDAMKDNIKDTSRFTVRLLDKVTVLGRTQPTVLYEVVGVADNVSKADKEKAAFANNTVPKFFNGNFQECLADLNKWAQTNGYDFAFDKLAERCRINIEEPPANFDGINRLDSK